MTEQQQQEVKPSRVTVNKKFISEIRLTVRGADKDLA